MHSDSVRDVAWASLRLSVTAFACLEDYFPFWVSALIWPSDRSQVDHWVVPDDVSGWGSALLVRGIELCHFYWGGVLLLDIEVYFLNLSAWRVVAIFQVGCT